MKRINVLILLLSSIFLLQGLQAQDNCFEMWVNTKQKVCPQLVSNLEGYIPCVIDKSDFNRYGSYYKLKTDSTGFYYVKKIDGRWWLIDPDGYAGINMAVTSTIGIPAGRKMEAHLLLKDIGFNGIGNFVTPEKQTKDDYNAHVFEKMSYTRRSDSGGFFQRFRSARKNVLKRSFLATSTKALDDIITIFDPEFEKYCDTYAKEFQMYKNERELLGYFSDNEIYFGTNQLQLFLTELPDNDPNYIYAAEFAAEKGLSVETIKTSYSKITTATKEEFAGRIAEHYYRISSAAIKKYDPNHLYLGSRLHGTMRAIAPVVKQSAKYCDVVSVNFYDRTTPAAQITHPNMWGAWLDEFDKPAIVTEFYTKQATDEYPKQPGAGFHVGTQTHRGYFYQNTCFDLIKSKFYIGWQYFRWQDDYKPNAAQDQKFSNKGIVDVDLNEYIEMTAFMREMNSQIYRIIEHLDGKAISSPELETTVIPVSEATYVSFSEETLNFGNEQTIKLKLAENDAVLKFEIPFNSEDIYDATIKLYVKSSTGFPGKFLATAITDHDWSEHSITGQYINSNNIWSKIEGRLQTYENAMPQGHFIEYSVRNWLSFNSKKGEKVTFRLSELGESTIEFASNDYPDQSKRPQLILKTVKNGTGIKKESENALEITTEGSRLVVRGVNEPLVVQIYNMSGLQILNKCINSDSKIDLPVSNGMFIVKITGNYTVQSSKIIIK